MKIALLGYGQMGKAIEKIAIKRGHSVIFKTNDFNLKLICKSILIGIFFFLPKI